MNLRNFVLILVVSIFAGCASVPMSSLEESSKAKRFEPPTKGNAGIYIYRKDTIAGAALKKDVWIDGECIGETAKGMFFYEEVEGDKNHQVSTESEFSPNDLIVDTKSGNHYFINQYIKMGAFVGGANLELVNENEGKSEVASLKMAKKGSCSK